MEFEKISETLSNIKELAENQTAEIKNEDMKKVKQLLEKLMLKFLKLREWENYTLRTQMA